MSSDVNCKPYDQSRGKDFISFGGADSYKGDFNRDQHDDYVIHGGRDIFYQDGTARPNTGPSVILHVHDGYLTLEPITPRTANGRTDQASDPVAFIVTCDGDEIGVLLPGKGTLTFHALDSVEWTRAPQF